MVMWRGGSGKRKTVAQYEAEAERQPNGCLIHPSKGKKVARRVYKLRHGLPPKGLHVCHSCDTPLCIEDNHHWLGTPKQNMNDRDRKGRWGGGRPKRRPAK